MMAKTIKKGMQTKRARKFGRRQDRHGAISFTFVVQGRSMFCPRVRVADEGQNGLLDLYYCSILISSDKFFLFLAPGGS